MEPILIFCPKQARRIPGCSLQRNGRRNAGLHPQFHLMLHGGAVDDQKIPRVAAGYQRNSMLRALVLDYRSRSPCRSDTGPATCASVPCRPNSGLLRFRVEDPAGPPAAPATASAMSSLPAAKSLKRFSHAQCRIVKGSLLRHLLEHLRREFFREKIRARPSWPCACTASATSRASPV